MKKQKFLQLLQAGSLLEMSASTAFGTVHFNLVRKTGEEKRVLLVKSNNISMDELRKHENLSYEEAQDRAVIEVIDMLMPYQISHLEVKYARPFG